MGNNVIYLPAARNRQPQKGVHRAPKEPTLAPLGCVPWAAVRRARAVALGIVLLVALPAQQYWAAALFVFVAIFARWLMGGRRG